MRNITAEELAVLSQYYFGIGNIKRTEKYEREFEELQREYNKD